MPDAKATCPNCESEELSDLICADLKWYCKQCVADSECGCVKRKKLEATK